MDPMEDLAQRVIGWRWWWETLPAVLAEVGVTLFIPSPSDPASLEWYIYIAVYVGAALVGAGVGRLARILVYRPRKKVAELKTGLAEARDQIEKVKAQRPQVSAVSVKEHVSGMDPNVEQVDTCLQVTNKGAKATFHAKVVVLDGPYDWVVRGMSYPLWWERRAGRTVELLPDDDDRVRFAYHRNELQGERSHTAGLFVYNEQSGTVERIGSGLDISPPVKQPENRPDPVRVKVYISASPRPVGGPWEAEYLLDVRGVTTVSQPDFRSR